MIRVDLVEESDLVRDKEKLIERKWQKKWVHWRVWP